MKKLVVGLFFTIATLNAYSQEDIYPYADRRTGTLYMSKYDSFHEGDKIQLGKGSAPSGDFKYIYKSVARLPLRASDSGTVADIGVIRFQGTPKKGLKFFLILKGELKDFEIEVSNALGSGEIVSKDPNFKINTGNPPCFSVADELKKLKELLDQGVITQEEFDTQKKKLLEK
jgi:hypothetical protein